LTASARYRRYSSLRSLLRKYGAAALRRVGVVVSTQLTRARRQISLNDVARNRVTGGARSVERADAYAPPLTLRPRSHDGAAHLDDRTIEVHAKLEPYARVQLTHCLTGPQDSSGAHCTARQLGRVAHYEQPLVLPQLGHA